MTVLDQVFQGKQGGDMLFSAGVEVGKTYYYYIDSLSKSGTQMRLSPVLSKSVTG